MKRAFICIAGIDGSGKTTQARKLLDYYRQLGFKTAYAHCYHRSILLKPFKILAKITFMRGTDEFRDYAQYREKKTSASSRYRFFATIYGLIWFLDYCIQMFIQVNLRTLNDVLIVDRYIYDTGINISLTLSKPVEYCYRLMDLFLKFSPEPTHFFLIDIPEEIAFGRKDDIQSVLYLKERRERYLQIADKYGARVLNGELKPESLQRQLVNMLQDIMRN